MRQFQFKNDEEVFTLLELSKELSMSDQEFDTVADLQIGEEISFADDVHLVIQRIQDVKEIEAEVAHGD